jgi:DNA-binding transcriptional MerR regulator
MTAEPTYSTAEVCELLRISKSTLFRWEKEGLISPPGRDLQQQREYTLDHIREIGAWRLRKQLEQVTKAEGDPSAEERMDSLAEYISLTKFVAFGDISGLYELAERSELSTRTMQQLLRAAAEREPTDEAFQLIVGELVGSRTSEAE